MSLVVTNKGGMLLPPLESGVYTGICVGIVDMGEQHSERFKKYKHEILFVFEVVGEFVDVDGEQKPRWLSRAYTASLNDKSNLANALKAWRGRSFTEDELKGFDISQLLCTGCQLQVLMEEKNGRAYNNIQGIFGLSKNIKLEKPISETFLFDMDNPDKVVFEKLPEWMRKRIEASPTWAKVNAGTESMGMDLPKNPPQAIPQEKPQRRIDPQTGEVLASGPAW